MAVWLGGVVGQLSWHGSCTWELRYALHAPAIHAMLAGARQHGLWKSWFALTAAGTLWSCTCHGVLTHAICCHVCPCVILAAQLWSWQDWLAESYWLPAHPVEVTQHRRLRQQVQAAAAVEAMTVLPRLLAVPG